MQRSTADLSLPSAQPSLSHSGGYPIAPYGAYAYPGGLPGQMPAPPPMARQWPTLPELVNALKRRMVLATFLGLLVGAAAGAGVWLALPRGKHEVKALIQMQPYTPLLGKGQSEEDFESFKKNQVHMMRLRSLLGRVVSDAKVARTSFVQDSDDPIRDLDERLRTRWESPELLAVYMTGDDPNDLKIVLDTLMTHYQEDAKASEYRRRAVRRTDLENSLAALNKEIEKKERELGVGRKFGASGNLAGDLMKAQMLETEIRQYAGRISEMKLLTNNLESKLIENRQYVTAIKDLPVDAVELQAVMERDERYLVKTAELNKKEQELDTVRGQVAAGAPVLKAIENEVQQLHTDIKSLVATLRPVSEVRWRSEKEKGLKLAVGVAEGQLKDTQRQLASLTKAKADAQSALESLNFGAVGAEKALAELKPLYAKKDSLDQEVLDIRTMESRQPMVTLKEESAVTLNQNLKQKVLLSIAGAIVGYALILLLVAFLEWRSRRVDSVEQVVNELGMRVIGTIPAFPSKASLKSGDAATSQNWRFILNESVNSARTMLLHAAKTQNMQVLMVTSAMQGEGKTSLSSQLATSMATAGLRTLILDGDLRNPSMHKLFDAPLTPGCSEILCQEVDVSDAVQPTSVPNLWMIPAGQCSNRVIAALAQGHPLETLFNRLRGQFDFVVVDSCPVLPVADALLIGQHVDGVVISVLQDISQLPKVQNASDKLTALNILLLGAVVNGVKPDIHAYGYNYVKQLPA